MVEGETQAFLQREKEGKTQRWGYESRFKYYLYRIGILGNEGVESMNNFPMRIELNDTWQNRLNDMKIQSLDGVERWVPVGMKEDRKLDFIPETFVKGRYTHAKVLNPERVKAKYGIVHNIGDIHSHPSDWFNSLGVRLIVATRLVKDFEGFSDGDLYAMVDGKGLAMSAVVEQNHNYFVFRTAETKDLEKQSPLRSYTAFRRHWARKYHGYHFGKNNNIFWASPKFSLNQLNIGIAEAYNLAFYKGKPGEDLVRVFPQI